jgi:3'(2'), 5'-bisphosphate nucleotidase
MGLRAILNISQCDIDYIVAAVDHASQEIMRVYAMDFAVLKKADSSPVTQADLLANEILVNAMLKRWPEIPVLSEESAGISSPNIGDYYWAIDPLDGTKEFIQKNGQFTVNVALIEKGKPILGVLAAPALDLLYTGQIGKGAKKRVGLQWSSLPLALQEPDWILRDAPITVLASRSHPSQALIDWLAEYPNHQLQELGSSLKLCRVAEGGADCYPRLAPTSIWDIAAGHAILSAVGGEVWVWPITDRQPLRYQNPMQIINPSFIAAGHFDIGTTAV